VGGWPWPWPWGSATQGSKPGRSAIARPLWPTWAGWTKRQTHIKRPIALLTPLGDWGSRRRERTTPAATSQDWAKTTATFNEYVRHELDCNEHVR
jgi:hypothetical protein